jgi:hypothetical protein
MLNWEEIDSMKKKNAIIITLIILLTVIIFGIIMLVNTNIFNETIVKSDLKKLTKSFYGYYYDDNDKDEDIKTFLTQFKGTGLSITLGDLEIYLEARTGKKIKYKSLEKCDRANTKVIIYPKKPFKKSDIDLKYELNCK